MSGILAGQAACAQAAGSRDTLYGLEGQGFGACMTQFYIGR